MGQRVGPLGGPHHRGAIDRLEGLSCRTKAEANRWIEVHQAEPWASMLPIGGPSGWAPLNAQTTRLVTLSRVELGRLLAIVDDLRFEAEVAARALVELPGSAVAVMKARSDLIEEQRK